MQALPDGVIVRVLNQLCHVHEFVSCSAVSKAWASAVRECKPTSLVIRHCRHDPEEMDTAIGLITWLQRWQQQGCLQNLHEFSLLDDLHSTEYKQTPWPSPLSQSIIMIASFCNLQTCSLCGPFCFTTATAVLPASLKTLILWPEVLPAAIRLSSFGRLINLETLDVSCGTILIEGLDQSEMCDFILDATVSRLTSLCIWDSFCCKMAPTLTAGLSLPNLCEFYGNIKADREGMELADAIIALPHLEALGIDFQNGNCPDWNLDIPQTSPVRTVELRGPQVGPRISLRIAKPVVEYSHCRLHTVQSANPPCKMGFAYYQ